MQESNRELIEFIKKYTGLMTERVAIQQLEIKAKVDELTNIQIEFYMLPSQKPLEEVKEPEIVEKPQETLIKPQKRHYNKRKDKTPKIEEKPVKQGKKGV